MVIAGFFFAAVSGYLVGIMGSSNNPISGLTLTALVVTALILVALGVQKEAGVATVLGVAAIVCVSAAVAGEMLQDLKAGHILGGTPWRMQVGDILGVILSGAVMFVVLAYLNEGDIYDPEQSTKRPTCHLCCNHYRSVLVVLARSGGCRLHRQLCGA
jgi:putative OPT family oligopeptide transporter